MDLSANLEALLGPKGWVTPPDTKLWQRDWLNSIGEPPLGVARPTTSCEVAQIVARCQEARVPLVTQGGNTGLVGGSVLRQTGGVILSMSRMDKICAPENLSGAIEVEAGAVLGVLHQVLAGTGLMFPLRLGSEGSAQIGGLISTNAGGSQAFRYGLMQDLVLGLEVVLSDGSIWNGMRHVQKDNAGYQLRKLFCGAEGSLGIVTRAILKLVPEPVQEVTALLSVPNMTAAMNVASLCRARAGEFLNALEFFSDTGLEMALRNIAGLNFPLQQGASFYILVEAGSASTRVPLEVILSEVMEDSINSGAVIDGVLAMSKGQRASLWRIREEQPEGQRREGAQLKHDLAVPPQLLADFLERASSECNNLLDGVRINPFGHLGDGNVHYNLSPPIGQDGFAGLEEEFALRLGRLASELGGSFAAEHGLGSAKVALADQLRDPLERGVMARLKSVFDITGILNPGVIVAAEKHHSKIQWS
jgi:FAD/FMN-containing dehydrogenase